MKSNAKSTLCVHEGTLPDEYSGINTPICTSTSYEYLDTEERIYPRYFNIPNQKVLIDKLAALEHTASGLIFVSGMAAISTTLLSLLNTGDHILLQKGLYGGTTNFVVKDFKRLGIEYTFLTGNTSDDFLQALKPNTKIVYIESPSNPLLAITDLQMVSDVCKGCNLISVIDNTFASSINQTPADFGIDVIIHSATKYLGGHSDIQAGAVLSSIEIIKRIYSTSLNLGGSLNPQICALLERSIKTLAIRVERQNHNALEIAKWLEEQSKVLNVYYPGLPSFENHATAKKQMKGFGGMLAFERNNPNTYDFQKRLKLIKPVMSLGGVESTICSPVLTSHRHLSEEQKVRDGIRDGHLRLSVGIEDVEDIIADLKQAF